MVAASHLSYRSSTLRWIVAVLLLLVAAGASAVSSQPIVLSTPRYRAAFRPTDGALVSLRQTGCRSNLLWSGPDGLWQARFQDGTVVRSADFDAGAADQRFEWKRRGTATIEMRYVSHKLTVTISVSALKDGLSCVSEVTPATGTVIELALPARLRFSAGKAKRVVCPADGNQGVGMAFRGALFLPQPQNHPAAWEVVARGAGMYSALYGGPLVQRAVVDPPVPLKVTRDGLRLLGQAGSALGNVPVMVNRAPTRAQADVTLLDSANGPWLSGCHLGGSGFLWRIGGGVSTEERGPASRAVSALLHGLARQAGAGRDRIGVIALTNGPARGAWCDVTVSEWLQAARSAAESASGMRAVVLRTPAEVAAAVKGGRFQVVLNPYGEGCPELGAGQANTVAQIAGYVRGGGNWIEVGGHAFYCVLRPIRYVTYSGRYPAMFADYLHLDSVDGAAGVWRVQPQSGAWEGAQNASAIFVPGTLGCGSDAKGGYLDRAYATFAPAGKTWRAPASRITVGLTPEVEIAQYCAANGVRRHLREKMSAALLARFRRAVLVLLFGSAKDKTTALPQLPVPTLVHYCDYLHGGFDKQYPDHLPPNAGFGSERDLRQFIDEARAAGHLTMPYTNPTWWCDHPKGPTFEREGEGPLLKMLDGKPRYERYAQNDGWTVCHWDPAVRAANERTRRLFTRDFPSDMLFEDQCGARSWEYDTNPASPTPYAYTDGLLSMVNDDARVVPLSTEAGWDRVVNGESQLCGMSFSLVPTEYAPDWRRLYKDTYPASLWTVYPLAQRIAHDKAAMIYHDLGQFVTNRQVLSWALGLGFAMSYRVSASEVSQPASREWLRWLDRVQKSVCARYVGEPVGQFVHARSTRPGTTEDGVMRATYGPVQVTANLDGVARSVDGSVLAPFGFRASASGMIAGSLTVPGGTGDGVSFVTERTARRLDVWVYGPGSCGVRVQVAGGLRAPLRLRLDDGQTVRGSAVRGQLAFLLPSVVKDRRVMPLSAMMKKAPAAWPGERSAIGVLDLGGAIEPTWTRITPSMWLDGLRRAAICRELGVPVRAIHTVAEMDAALATGSRRWLAIINPYGEGLPVSAPGVWRQTLSHIRDYVRNGGNWWETGGYTFHSALVPDTAGWKREEVGPAGMAYLGLPVGDGEVDAPSVPLKATNVGVRWLGTSMAKQLTDSAAPANRGLPRGSSDPGHVTLVAAGGVDYIGGYRLGGWGWFWRVGGFWPDERVTVPVVASCLRYVYTHPPVPAAPDRQMRLWHAVAALR